MRDDSGYDLPDINHTEEQQRDEEEKGKRLRKNLSDLHHILSSTNSLAFCTVKPADIDYIATCLGLSDYRK